MRTFKLHPVFPHCRYMNARWRRERPDAFYAGCKARRPVLRMPSGYEAGDHRTQEWAGPLGRYFTIDHWRMRELNARIRVKRVSFE